MIVLGRACLILALATCVYGVGASLYGARTRRREWADSGRRAMYALAGIVVIAFGVLEAAFLRSDFSFDVVGSHSSTTTPTFYKATAVWSSQQGSLLLWIVLLALWSSLALFLTRRRMREVTPYATAVLLGFGAFFAFLLVFVANPFEAASPIPAQGTGLNPLLRHPSMMIHPPMLYSGYTLAAVPFAFAIGALIARRLDAEWISATRRFSMAAWLCLGVGILLGARWSYVELGWGGYWGWDPVENASLMPWLTGTAFLHSIMIQEKRGMLKVWNVSLVLATGTLAIVGTFLVRSGVLDSIHAFVGEGSGVAWSFTALIAAMVAGSVYLVASRRAGLRSEHRLDSLFSREAVFLLNNLVLVALCFVIFWGTFFPLISEAITGTKASVGPPWFSRYVVPLALILALLSGIGPVIAWRRATLANLARNFLWPLGAALFTLLALLGLSDAARKPLALGMFCVAAFVLAAVGQELWRGSRARGAMTGEVAPVALVGLVRRNRRRFGGYLVHAGVAVLFVGVAGSTAFQHARDVRLSPGQSAHVGRYELTYVRPTARLASEKVSLGAVLDVREGGKRVGQLRPTRGYYPSLEPGKGPVQRIFDGQATSEVGLRAGLRRDLWTAIEPDLGPLQAVMRDADRRLPNAGADLQGFLVTVIAERYRQHPPPATFRILDSPLVTWIWLGALIAFSGALIALSPAPALARRRARAPAAQPARAARGLGRA
ncbi:MAG: cytochrome c biogenesis protein CcsA [Actinomycetota bacterium]|nr:cytochrome c biogenesis protein CcsA [Actinomycetota bacterium]